MNITNRKLTSKKDRANLYLDFDGICAECGVELIKWHADHKIPFVLTHKTEYSNMQPLCPPCNLRKGKKVIMKNKNYYESINLGLHLDIAPFRIGQKGAFNCIVENVLDHAQTISIVLPTRYGKSDVIRASAIELTERGIVDGCLLAAPCRFLRDELCNKKKIDEMVSRYTIGTSRPVTYDILENFRLPIFQNDEHFVGLTTQMLANNCDEICRYIKLHTKRTGKLFLVYIDESHTSSESNVWGAAVPKINEAGGIVILLTATPFRDNGQKIPGFNCIVESKGEKKRYVPRKHEDPSKYYLDIYMDLEGEMKLEADYEYSFKSAWAEGNVLCKVARREFDVVVKIPDGNTNEPEKMKEINISQMTTSECSKYFGKVVRDSKVIKTGVSELIGRLQDYRLLDASAQAIVFCGNDLEEDIDDGHAKQIATEISCQNNKLKVVVATSKSTNADDLIKDFEKGKGDILIVKQMASLGMDIAPIKLGLDLSAIRTLAAFIQRMMRTATMWGKNQVAHLIIPSDVNGQALWTGFIEENGGAMTSHQTRLVDTQEKDKKDCDSIKKDMEVIRTESAILSDSCGEGTSDTNDYNDYAKPLILGLPKIQAVYSDHELVNYGKQFGKEALSRLNDKPKEPIRDITEQRIMLKNRIKLLRGEIASKRYNYGKEKEKWINENKTCLNQVKRQLGIPLRTQLNKITNIKQLTQIKDLLEKKKDDIVVV